MLPVVFEAKTRAALIPDSVTSPDVEMCARTRSPWILLTLICPRRVSRSTAVRAYDVNHQTRIGLTGIEMRRRRFHRRGDANFILLPGLHGDRAGKVFQF